MTNLDEPNKHQAKLAKTIVEFEIREELLQDYSQKFTEVNVEISDLETELILWKKRKKISKKSR